VSPDLHAKLALWDQWSWWLMAPYALAIEILALEALEGLK